MDAQIWDGTKLATLRNSGIEIKPRLRWRAWWALRHLALPALLGMAGGAVAYLLLR